MKQKTKLEPIMENDNNQQIFIPEPETVLLRKKAIDLKTKEKEEKFTSVLVKNLKKENDHQQLVKEAVNDAKKNKDKLQK